MKKYVWAAALLLSGSSLHGQTPAEPLARPPAEARHYLIVSTGGQHGDSYLWTTADGTRMARESINLRGQIFETDMRGVAGSDGMPATLQIHGFTPQGDAAERFQVAEGQAQWTSPIDHGQASYQAGSYYNAFGGPVATTAWLADALLAAPAHKRMLLPGGEASAEKLGAIELRGTTAADRRTVELWAINGINNSPTPIWMDQGGHFFALVGFLSWLPEPYVAERKALDEAQSNALAEQTARLAVRLAGKPQRPQAFVHVKLYDADRRRFLADQTVVVDGARIAAVGAAARVRVPDGAQLIDGRGKTLLPGLWDCHMHIGDDYTGVQELSMGVTSVRDPGNDDRRTLDRRQREQQGKLLMPHVYPSSLIDGKGPYAAQVANIATSQAEAVSLVDRAKANGFTGVKFYGTFNPAWLPAAIAEAHKLGLHVHGHIPAGMRPMDAIADGYDEITHINWIIMQAMPDSVIAVSNSAARFEGPGRYAKDVDLDGPAMTSIVQTMAKRHIYSDPTMVAFEALYVPDNGDLSPAYAPFVGTLPPTIERTFRAGGFAVPKDLTRADYRASWAKMIELLRRMHRAGIPIVAGTDGAGIELVRELEIYQQAGFTPAEALATATIVPARLVGADRHTGSIVAGKNADLVLVEGDPEQRMADLRQTRVVMLDGKLLDPDALRSAAGYSGRPH